MSIHRFNRFGRIVLAVLVVFAAASLTAGGCGSKKKKPFFFSQPEQPDVGGTVYNCAASVGDLLTYQFNTSTLEYSYLVVEGAAAGQIGNGALTPLGGFGNDVYSTTDGDTVLLLPDAFALMQAPDNSLIAGVPTITGSYNASEIAGIYNYLIYDGDDEGAPATQYGTIVVKIDGTWEIWIYDDAATSAGSPFETGSWVDTGSGIVHLFLDFYPWGKIGSIMFLPSPGGNLMVMDVAIEGAFIIGAEQQALPTDGSLDGTYDVLDSTSDIPYTNTLAGTSLTTPSGVHTLTYNFPWDGFVTDVQDFIGFITPQGIFIAIGDTGSVDFATVAIRE